MESRLKERLTGAAILVALIVLLVPEMFRGQRGDVATTASSGEGPPVRSYTIDLSNGPDRTAPLQSTPAATIAPDTGTATATANPAANAAAAAAAAANSTPAADLAPAAPARPSAAPSAAPTPTATAKPPSSPAAAAHAAGGAWSVQLGLFAQHDNAERLVHSAQSKGFAVVVSERDAKGLYHVEVENLGDRAAAQAMQSRLHDQGLPAAVVPPPARH